MKINKFWLDKKLKDLNHDEWESLCDHCGKCCVIKLQNEESNELYYTNVSCKLLDIKTSQCKNYKNRKKLVPDCIILTSENIGEIAYWMPETCGYRRIFYGNSLEPWHPLISNDASSAIKSGETIANQAISELDINEEDLEDYIKTDLF